MDECRPNPLSIFPSELISDIMIRSDNGMIIFVSKYFYQFFLKYIDKIRLSVSIFSIYDIWLMDDFSKNSLAKSYTDSLEKISNGIFSITMGYQEHPFKNSPTSYSNTLTMISQIRYDILSSLPYILHSHRTITILNYVKRFKEYRSFNYRPIISGKFIKIALDIITLNKVKYDKIILEQGGRYNIFQLYIIITVTDDIRLINHPFIMNEKCRKNIFIISIIIHSNDLFDALFDIISDYSDANIMLEAFIISIKYDNFHAFEKIITIDILREKYMSSVCSVYNLLSDYSNYLIISNIDNMSIYDIYIKLEEKSDKRFFEVFRKKINDNNQKKIIFLNSMKLAVMSMVYERTDICNPNECFVGRTNSVDVSMIGDLCFSPYIIYITLPCVFMDKHKKNNITKYDINKIRKISEDFLDLKIVPKSNIIEKIFDVNANDKKIFLMKTKYYTRPKCMVKVPYRKRFRHNDIVQNKYSSGIKTFHKKSHR